VDQQLVEPVELVELEAVVLVHYLTPMVETELSTQEVVEADVCRTQVTLLEMVVQELLF
tara:strand:+ start:706 stop:882 length:177 start_codon:yes stop_codon:yes gene_type:complete